VDDITAAEFLVAHAQSDADLQQVDALLVKIETVPSIDPALNDRVQRVKLRLAQLRHTSADKITAYLTEQLRKIDEDPNGFPLSSEDRERINFIEDTVQNYYVPPAGDDLRARITKIYARDQVAREAQATLVVQLLHARMASAVPSRTAGSSEQQVVGFVLQARDLAAACQAAADNYYDTTQGPALEILLYRSSRLVVRSSETMHDFIERATFAIDQARVAMHAAVGRTLTAAIHHMTDVMAAGHRLEQALGGAGLVDSFRGEVAELNAALAAMAVNQDVALWEQRKAELQEFKRSHAIAQINSTGEAVDALKSLAELNGSLLALDVRHIPAAEYATVTSDIAALSLQLSKFILLSDEATTRLADIVELHLQQIGGTYTLAQLLDLIELVLIEGLLDEAGPQKQRIVDLVTTIRARPVLPAPAVDADVYYIAPSEPGPDVNTMARSNAGRGQKAEFVRLWVAPFRNY
jgi:hypothetical protein